MHTKTVSLTSKNQLWQSLRYRIKTWARVDMEFLYVCPTHEWAQLMRYKVEREKRNSVSTSNDVMFILLAYSKNKVFDDFSKISDHFPRISEDSTKVIRSPHEAFQTFSENLRILSKISKESQRFPRMNQWCFYHTATHQNTF